MHVDLTMKNIFSIFVPKEEKFFDMLKKQSENAVTCTNIFKSLLEEYSGLSDAKRKSKIELIEQVEINGDKQTHEIIEILNKTFITPIDREDIHSVCIILDEVIDLINETAQKIILYRIEKIPKDMLQMTNIIANAINEINNGVSNLKELKKIRPICINVHSAENEANITHYRAIAELFNNSKMPIEVIKEKDIYELLEKVANKCEDIAHVLDGIVVKYA